MKDPVYPIIILLNPQQLNTTTVLVHTVLVRKDLGAQDIKKKLINVNIEASR